jgi:hypothetical protein
VAAVARVTVRLSDRMSVQLEEAARERGVPPARLVRQLIGEAVAGRPVALADPPTEEELVALLWEKARQENVAAIRSLLARDHVSDPRERALVLFQEMIAERQP